MVVAKISVVLHNCLSRVNSTFVTIVYSLENVLELEGILQIFFLSVNKDLKLILLTVKEFGFLA